MQYGIYISNYVLNGDPRNFVKLAKEAEECNWDGFFMWDHINPETGFKKGVADPWIALSGIAAVTERIRIGTTVTPLPRRRPQKVARETASLDVLSNGRLILGVGLGGPTDAEFECEDTSTRIRAEKLDESLDIITSLWSGEPYSFQGKHYKFDEVTFKPRPIQKPRIPIWCAGSWPLKKPFERAVKYDGVFPLGHSGDLELSDYEDIGKFVAKHRTRKDPFDIVCMGVSTGDPKKDSWIDVCAEYGSTWYVEVIWKGKMEDAVNVVQRGPPRYL
ncbi:MAG: LLM class flavin-dependent oxidoreductase [Candidatus Thorarchaeota archaeon]|jgi:alkanesulfonate monooxygenase SsuD/methylene tetrahydromethanopterin reductase-like flavin-dependent oxidoreductase (luciferase family)